MTTLLAGDIGGTKTLLQLTSGNYSYRQRYLTKNFADLESIVHTFLHGVAEETGTQLRPQFACLGVAGPVRDNCATLTNVGWHLDGTALGHKLGIEQVQLINDFGAVAYGIFQLQEQDLYCLQAGKPQPQGSIAVIGAGTGLGQAYLTWTGTGYQVHTSEGGHSSFAPTNPLEMSLLQFLWQTYPQAVVEQVVSGQGISHIYDFLGDYYRGQISPTLDLSQVPDKAAAIASAVGVDRLATLTMELFVSAYGAEAGNLALKILATGGLYVAGGIASQNVSLFTENQRFISAMLNKDKVSQLLATVPTFIILNPDVGLMGAMAQAQRMANLA